MPHWRLPQEQSWSTISATLLNTRPDVVEIYTGQFQRRTVKHPSGLEYKFTLALTSEPSRLMRSGEAEGMGNMDIVKRTARMRIEIFPNPTDNLILKTGYLDSQSVSQLHPD